MFFSLFLILFFGVIFSFLSKKIRIPSLVFYLLFGILLSYLDGLTSASGFSFLDDNLMRISSDIRKIALIIILLKAELSLDLKDLKKVGRPAILMSFLPAVVEMTAIGIFAPYFFKISYTESFLLGSVLGAVSPAVVIPMMSKLLEEKYGTREGIPQLVIAASSIDDIVMIVFYQSFLTMEQGQDISAMTFLNIPISILTGIVVGILFGFLLSLVFLKTNLNNLMKLVLLLSISFGLTYFESFVSSYFGYSSLLSIITMALVIHKKDREISLTLKNGCNKLWSVAEIFLFTLVGASIKIEYAGMYFLPALLLLLISLSFRSLTVSGCLIKTKLNLKERGYVILSFLPKATVQAAIGGGLLDLGNRLLQQGASNAESVIASGTIVLSVSVVSILITAPISAILLNLLYPKMLKKEEEKSEAIE